MDLRWPSTDVFLVPVPACAEIRLFCPNYLLKGTHIGPVENGRSRVREEEKRKPRRLGFSTEKCFCPEVANFTANRTVNCVTKLLERAIKLLKSQE